MASSQDFRKVEGSSHRWNIFKHKSTKQALPVQNGDTSASSPINAVYYPNWRVYRQQPPSSMNLEFITHIFYAFAWVRSKGDLFFSDEYADIEMDLDGAKGGLGDLKAVKQRFPHIKIILSVGGGGEGSAPFPSVSSSGLVRSMFAQSARTMVDAYGLDGIDIDWEHPSDPKQGQHYVQLLSAVRKSLPAPKYMLTSALPAGEWALKNIDLARAWPQLDLINLMTYDFSGPWTDACGHHAQLYTPNDPHNDAAKISCSSAVAYLTSKGVPPGKILLGIPTYGRSFLDAANVGDRFSGMGGEEGTFEYMDLPRPGSALHFDDAAGAAYSVGGEGGFVTFDDPRTVRMKAQFAQQQGLAGLFFWTGTGDTKDDKSLVETGFRALHAS